MYIFVSAVVGPNTYRLIEIAHALLVGPAIFHAWVAPTLARRIRQFACVTLERGGKGRRAPPWFIVVEILIRRWFELMGGLAVCCRIGRRPLNRLPRSSSMSSCS